MDKYKKTYISRIESKIYSGNLLRVISYLVAGIFIGNTSLKWFIGSIVAFLFIIIGQFMDSNIDELKDKLKRIKGD